MTESDWLASDNPAAMLSMISGSHRAGDHALKDVVRYRPSERKLRLFACACCRIQAREIIPNGWSSLDVEERHADGVEPTDEEKVKHGNWTHTSEGLRHMLAFVVGHRVANKAIQAALLRDVVGSPFAPVPSLHNCPRCTTDDMTEWDGGVLVCHGCDHRFRHPWLTPTVLRIARTLYADRDFASTPILADALEESGCGDEMMLRHLRGEERCTECLWQGVGMREGFDAVQTVIDWGRQKKDCPGCKGTGWRPRPVACVKGCWALDLLLGKE